MVKTQIGFYNTLATCANMVGRKQKSSHQAAHMIKSNFKKLNNSQGFMMPL